MNDKAQELQNLLKRIVDWSQNQPELAELAREAPAFDATSEVYLHAAAAGEPMPHDGAKGDGNMEFGKELLGLAISPMRFLILIWATHRVIKDGIPGRWKDELVGRGLPEDEAARIVDQFMGDLAKLCPGAG